MQNNSFSLSRTLMKLYSEDVREKSAADVRKIVAQHSRKFYFANGSQQDCEEFMRDLITTLADELKNVVEFRTVKNEHFGCEQIKRFFVDNPPTGTCHKCGQYPSSREDEFLCLKLTVPESTASVNLSSLIDDYFSESVGNIRMKCTFCCEHEKRKELCPQIGFCGRPAATRHELSKAPKYLMLQLLRFRYDTGVKVMTHVKVSRKLKLPNNEEYESVAFLNHRGFSMHAGHYVAFIKNESGHWILFDDTTNCPASFEAANTAENYILMFQKIVPVEDVR